MAIRWIGPGGGLGNRILALGAVLALSKSLQSTIAFPWHVLPVCPAEFHDLFEDMPGINVDNSIGTGNTVIGENRWEPYNIFQEFEKEIQHKIPLEEYCYNFIESLRSLKFQKSILDELGLYRKQTEGTEHFAIHIRRTDRVTFHKNSLRKLLSVKSFKNSLTVINNVGFRKTLQYSLFPVECIRNMENKNLAEICRNLLDRNSDLRFSIYSDSYDELLTFQQLLRSQGVSEEYYVPSYCNKEGRSEIWGTFGRRNTSVQSALIELLGMSMSNGILQNISASSFSICSSIIGGTPILTSQPRHLFWRVIQTTLGKAPYEIKTEYDKTLHV